MKILNNSSIKEKLSFYNKIFFSFPKLFILLSILAIVIGFLINGLSGIAWSVIIVFILRFVILPIFIIVSEKYLEIVDIPKDISTEKQRKYHAVEFIGELIRIILPVFGAMYGFILHQIYMVIIGILLGLIVGLILEIIWNLIAHTIIKD